LHGTAASALSLLLAPLAIGADCEGATALEGVAVAVVVVVQVGDSSVAVLLARGTYTARSGLLCRAAGDAPLHEGDVDTVDGDDGGDDAVLDILDGEEAVLSIGLLLGGTYRVISLREVRFSGGFASSTKSARCNNGLQELVR
jgi:hypothetical protein